VHGVPALPLSIWATLPELPGYCQRFLRNRGVMGTGFSSAMLSPTGIWGGAATPPYLSGNGVQSRETLNRVTQPASVQSAKTGRVHFVGAAVISRNVFHQRKPGRFGACEYFGWQSAACTECPPYHFRFGQHALNCRAIVRGSSGTGASLKRSFRRRCCRQREYGAAQQRCPTFRGTGSKVGRH